MTSQPSARSNNALVHRYGKIDDRIAQEILVEHLDDFYEFNEVIEEFPYKVIDV
ncbi:MAG: HepT-like ribonuclease domain-containing protein [Thermoplasmata archaeon]